MMKYVIDLPFPISVNRLWRVAGNRHHLAPAYVRWTEAADKMWLAQKRPGRPMMLGHYTLDVVLSRECRHGNADGDNLLKCVNDWCQRIELIQNDKYCERWSGSWGVAEAGCRVTLEGEPYAAGDC